MATFVTFQPYGGDDLVAAPLRTDQAQRRRCIRAKRNGDPCGAWAIHGSTVCLTHGGRAPQIRKKAHVRAELMRWGLNDQDQVRDPDETLLRLLAQSAARCELYSKLLGDAFIAGEQQERDDPAGETGMARVLATGGVKALIGVKKAVTPDGLMYDVEEVTRGLAKLESEERDRCARFAKLAADAGIMKRQIEIAEKQAAMVMTMIRSVLGDERLALSEAQLEQVPFIIDQKIGELISGG